ncbi:MAG: hypothetical protein AAF570_03140, partial [Bacteroidota bacterium]
GNQQQIYAAEVTEYTDGTVAVLRTTMPYDPSKNYVHTVLGDNVPVSHSALGTEVDFSGMDGWFVPFDPGVQALRVTGRVIDIDCECDTGPSGCDVDVYIDPTTGKVDIACLGSANCTGNCLAHLTFGPDKFNGGGILINALNLHTP